MFAMVALGVGQIFGCFYSGFLVDKCGSKFVAKQNCLILTLALFSVSLYVSIDSYSPTLAYTMTFMWGLQDSCINTHL
jgi:predicted MFS family arabinose efflux permease